MSKNRVLAFHRPHPLPLGVSREPTSERSQFSLCMVRRVFLIEWRNEVFARLSADLSARELRVVRGKGPVMAWWRFRLSPSDLLLVSLAQADGGGWSLIRQLRTLRPGVRIWAYGAQLRPLDLETAHQLRVDELIEYRGDLLGLSDQLVDRVETTLRPWNDHAAGTSTPHVHYETPAPEQNRPSTVRTVRPNACVCRLASVSATGQVRPFSTPSACYCTICSVPA
jgi:hypothetical protein